MSDTDFIEEEKPAPSSSRLSGPLHRLVPNEGFVPLGKVTQRMSKHLYIFLISQGKAVEAEQWKGDRAEVG